MKKEFNALYNLMASSEKVEYMHIFGEVHREMFEWFVANKPDLAKEWLDKLEAIRWNQYLSPKEADAIVARMDPKAPWTKEQWKAEMQLHGFDTEKVPCYNSCALWTAMEMIMSDSGQTLRKYVGNEDLFKAVHDLAVDKLQDKDGVFVIRDYFGL